MLRALATADDGGDARSGPRGELRCEMPNAAGGASDQHSFAEKRRAISQCSQRRQTGDRQSCGLLEEDVVGQYRHPVGRHRGALCPAGVVGECHDTRAGSGTGTAGGRLNHDPADVLARPPAVRPDLKQPQLAAVEREGAHLDDRLVRRRLRFGYFVDRDRRRAVGGVDYGEHLHPPRSVPILPMLAPHSPCCGERIGMRGLLHCPQFSRRSVMCFGSGSSSPRSTRLTMSVSTAFVGAAMPTFWPSRTTKPFRYSISVRRPFTMSWPIDGRCSPPPPPTSARR